MSQLIIIFVLFLLFDSHTMTLMRENLNLLHMTNIGTDQPAHLHSLIRTFDAHFLKKMMAKLATFKISTS